MCDFGYFRALEINENHEEDTYHPHFHVLLPVKESYFIIITLSSLEDAYEKAMKLDYTQLSIFVE